MRTLHDQWASYENSVIPKSAPAIQTQECRRAFYAGAQAMMGMVAEVGNSGVSEDAGVALLESFKNELNDFLARVGADY